MFLFAQVGRDPLDSVSAREARSCIVIVGLDQSFVIVSFGENGLNGEIRSSPKTLMVFLMIDMTDKSDQGFKE